MKTMKFFPAILFFLMFVCIPGVSSFASDSADGTADSLQRIIKESLKYPDEAIKHCCTGKVDVVFTVNEDGQLNIEEIYSDNSDIAKCVKKQLSTICCKGIKTPFNKHYAVSIAFKLV